MMKAFLAVTAIAVASSGFARDAAVAADAAPGLESAAAGQGSCGGKLVEYVPFVVGGKKIGQLQLYYNARNGKNCAIMYHGGPTWGIRKDTGVLLAKSATRNGAYHQAAYQRDDFTHQAGPITTVGRDKCVYAGGGISYNGKHHTKYTGFHCG